MSNSSASHRAPPLPLYCLQVTKVPLCPPLHISAEEARGVLVAPGSKPRPEGERMAASYINFYIANGGVVMPAFGGEAAEADERWAVGCGWQGVSLQGAVGRPGGLAGRCAARNLPLSILPPTLHPHPDRSAASSRKLQGTAGAGGRVPRPPRGGGAGARDCAGRRQHTLHHAAAAQGLAGNVINGCNIFYSKVRAWRRSWEGRAPVGAADKSRPTSGRSPHRCPQLFCALSSSW